MKTVNNCYGKESYYYLFITLFYDLVGPVQDNITLVQRPARFYSRHTNHTFDWQWEASWRASDAAATLATSEAPELRRANEKDHTMPLSTSHWGLEAVVFYPPASLLCCVY